MEITTFEGDIGYIPAFADGSLYIDDGMIWRPNGEYAVRKA